MLVRTSKRPDLPRGSQPGARRTGRGPAAASLAPAAVLLSALAAVAAPAAEPPGLASRVRAAGAGGAEWLAYTLPKVPGHGFACCFDRRFRRSPCRLEREHGGWGTSSDDPPMEGLPQDLAVYLRIEGGRVGRARAFSGGCAVDPEGVRLTWIEGVGARESIDLLAGLAPKGGSKAGKSSESLAEHAVAAIALHAGSEADAALADLASPAHSLDLREDAFLWLGTARGRAGCQTLTRLLRAEPDSEAREKIIFGLSQSEQPEAAGEILSAAENDRDPEVRGEALFWLAQTGAPIAPQGILRAIERDPSSDVREKGVFALSQLPDRDGTLLLIDLMRQNRSPEVRRQALFWLAQSDDPRALDLIEELLAEK